MPEVAGRDASADAEATLRRAARALRARVEDAPAARLEAEVLLAHVLGLSRGALLTLERLDPAACGRFEALVDERVRTARPVAYLTGRAWFRHLELGVDERVLVPRPETETLLQAFDALEAAGRVPPGPVLDRGTGSGCLALALGGARPVLATDRSAAALAVARDNVARVGPRRPLLLVQGEGLQAVRPRAAAAILVNPPYVEACELEQLAPDVARHEPHEALVPRQGTVREMYAELLEEAFEVLCPGGWLLTEVGLGQAADVHERACQAGYADLQRVRDLSGIERVVAGQRPA